MKKIPAFGSDEGAECFVETAEPSRPFRGTQIELLKDPENAALYLEEALAARDMDAFKLAQRNVAETRLSSSARKS